MRSYIVMVSPASGGTEKRFFDIVSAARRRGHDVAMVAPRSLIEQLKSDHSDRGDIFPGLIAVGLRRWNAIAFIREFRALLATLPHGARFHYPLNCLWPLHIGRGDVVTMSVPDCATVPHPISTKRRSVWAWISFFFVDRVDVLNPAIFEAMRRYRMAPKMSLTPGGTFLVPPAQSRSRKTPSVVFLGRLVPGKGVQELLDVLPHLWAALRNRVPPDFSVRIAGYGELQTRVNERVTALARAGIPVGFAGYVTAHEFLEDAGIFLSLQDSTNYPSRAVAEAMMAGCGVIVRDTGDSRSFGNLPGIVYCQPELDARELADLVAGMLRQVLDEPGFCARVRAAAQQRFSSDAYVDYFGQMIWSAA